MRRDKAEAIQEQVDADFDKVVSESFGAYIKEQLQIDMEDYGTFSDAEELADFIDVALREWVREQLENDMDLRETDR